MLEKQPDPDKTGKISEVVRLISQAGRIWSRPQTPVPEKRRRIKNLLESAEELFHQAQADSAPPRNPNP